MMKERNGDDDGDNMTIKEKTMTIKKRITMTGKNNDNDGKE